MTWERPIYYILTDHHIAVPCDLETWACMFENPANRIVQQTKIGPVLVSTVFLGLDHSFGAGDPVLFETMVFDAEAGDNWMCRYCTWEEAVRGHETTVKATEDLVAAAKGRIAAQLAELGLNATDKTEIR